MNNKNKIFVLVALVMLCCNFGFWNGVTIWLCMAVVAEEVIEIQRLIKEMKK